MIQFRSYTLLALAVGLALGSPLAKADATATSTLSQLKVWVFDLDPLDGLAPSFSILTGLGEWATTVAAIPSANPWLGNVNSVGTNLQSMISLGGASSTATLVGGQELGDFVLSATSSSTSGQTYGQAYMGFDIQVSAKTLLVVTAQGSGSSQALLNVAGESAETYSRISFFAQVAGTSVGSDAYLRSYTGFGYSIAAPTVSGGMTAAFSNDSLASRTLFFQALTSSVAQSPVTVVPEPATAALLLAGLGLVAAGARRRAIKG